MRHKTFLHGRYEVVKYGCEKCGRGVDRLEFVDTTATTVTDRKPQVLFDEVAEIMWDLIESSLRGTQR